LAADPLAFGSMYAAEVDRTDETWETWAVSAATGWDQAAFVADVDSRLVGLAGGFRMDDAPNAYHLFSMWTDRRHRRTGLGRALADSVIAWAKEAGGTRISLWVFEGNQAARRLYEGLEFTATGAKQRLAHNMDLTEVEMALQLGPATQQARDMVPPGYIEFAPMEASEFDRYAPQLIGAYADDLMRADGLSADLAAERAAIGIAELLPQGVATPSQHLCTLRAGLADEPVGVIWFAAVQLDERALTVIYDFSVDRTHRSRGYSSAALEELEEWSRSRQHQAIAIHVFEHNVSVRRLYERSGYVTVELGQGRLRMERTLV
jgi:GNAT superfamily N-acetyltransferase